MSIFCNHGRALASSLGVALFAALAAVSGCAALGDASDVSESPSEQISEPLAKYREYACTGDDGTSPMTLFVDKFAGTCFRSPGETLTASHSYCTGGECPSCYKLAGKYFKCVMM